MTALWARGDGDGDGSDGYGYGDGDGDGDGDEFVVADGDDFVDGDDFGDGNYGDGDGDGVGDGCGYPEQGLSAVPMIARAMTDEPGLAVADLLALGLAA